MLCQLDYLLLESPSQAMLSIKAYCVRIHKTTTNEVHQNTAYKAAYNDCQAKNFSKHVLSNIVYTVGQTSFQEPRNANLTSQKSRTLPSVGDIKMIMMIVISEDHVGQSDSQNHNIMRVNRRRTLEAQTAPQIYRTYTRDCKLSMTFSKRGTVVGFVLRQSTIFLH